MGSYTTPTRLLSMAGGFGLIGIGAWLNVADLAKLEGFTSPSVMLFYGFAGGVALAALITPTLWQDGQKMGALVVLVGLLCGECFAFYSTTERLLAARDERAGKVGDANAPRVLAEQARARALADLASAQARADTARPDRKCNSACQSNLDLDIMNAQHSLAAAEKRYLATSAIRDAKPLASKLGISQEVADIIPALLGSAALLIMGFGFTSAWRKPPTPEPVAEDIEVSPPQPSRRVRRDEAMAKIELMRERNGGVMPPFKVIKNELDLKPATASRYRKAAMGG